MSKESRLSQQKREARERYEEAGDRPERLPIKTYIYSQDQKDWLQRKANKEAGGNISGYIRKVLEKQGMPRVDW